MHNRKSIKYYTVCNSKGTRTLGFFAVVVVFSWFSRASSLNIRYTAVLLFLFPDSTKLCYSMFNALAKPQNDNNTQR